MSCFSATVYKVNGSYDLLQCGISLRVILSYVSGTPSVGGDVSTILFVMTHPRIGCDSYMLMIRDVRI